MLRSYDIARAFCQTPIEVNNIRLVKVLKQLQHTDLSKKELLSIDNPIEVSIKYIDDIIVFNIYVDDIIVHVDDIVIVSSTQSSSSSSSSSLD